MELRKALFYQAKVLFVWVKKCCYCGHILDGLLDFITKKKLLLLYFKHRCENLHFSYQIDLDVATFGTDYS